MNDPLSLEIPLIDLDQKSIMNYAQKNLNVEECNQVLEEILHNKFITSLDFTQNSLGDEQCETLSLFIKNNSNLKHLDLCKNNITSVGCASLANGLLDNTSLQYLSLQDNNLSESGIEEILKAIKTTKISNLNLKNTYFNNEGCVHFNEHLSNFIFLRKLNIDLNYISELGMEQISEFIKNSKNLESLSLVDNPIYEIGCKFLFMAIETNTSLKTLNISKTYISNGGCKFIYQSLSKNKTLTSFDISKNNINEEGAQFLGELIKVNSSLIELNLSDNQIFDNGCSYISEALKINTSILNLNLSSTLISTQGCKYLYEALIVNKGLQNLNLSDNSIHDDGFQYISRMLKDNKILYSLTMNMSHISDTSCQILAKGLEDNYTLHTLDLSQSAINPLGHKILSDREKQRNKEFKERLLISSYESPLNIQLPVLQKGNNLEFIFSCTTRIIILIIFLFILILISGGFALIIVSNPTINFVVIGGFGTRGAYNQTLISQTMDRFCKSNPCDFFITTGDNFLPNGISDGNLDDFFYSFKNIYFQSSLNKSWYPVFGDQDYLGNPSYQFTFSNNDSRWNFNDFYYKISKSAENLLQRVDIDFFMIDTTPFESYYLLNPNMNISTINRQNNSVQIQWINDEMAKSISPWKFIIGHHSPYGYDQRGNNFTSFSIDLVSNLVPIITKNNVQAYFGGHWHNQRYYELSNPFMTYFTSGSGSYYEPINSLNDPTLKYGLEECGFLYVSVYPAKIYINYVGSDGTFRATYRREVN